VGPDDIRGAVLGVLKEWWFPMLEDPSWLREHGSKYHAFAVITMCRALHAVEHGTIVSKPRAVAWAKKNLGNRWIHVIEKAVDAARADSNDGFLNETLDFIRFVKAQVKKFEKQIRNREILAEENHQQVK
jgi:hypothetical protein